MNKHTLQELVVSDGAINIITKILDSYLEETDKKEIEEIKEFVCKSPDYSDIRNRLELDTLINEALTNSELHAFYLGVDYAFNLLGREGVLELLPDSLRPEEEE